jgi:hypothetical protein
MTRVPAESLCHLLLDHSMSNSDSAPRLTCASAVVYATRLFATGTYLSWLLLSSLISVGMSGV